MKKYGIIKENNTNSNLSNTLELRNDINEFTILDIISILWKNRISIIKSVFLVTVTSAIISFLIPITYQSSAVLMPPSSQSNAGIIGAISELPLGGLLSQSNDETLKMIAILKSRTVMENVIHKFNLINIYQVEDIEEALELLRDYTVFKVEEEGTIRISVNVSTGWFHPKRDEEKTKKISADTLRSRASFEDIWGEITQSSYFLSKAQKVTFKKNWDSRLKIHQAEAHFNLGKVFLDKRKIGKAIFHYQMAIELNPGDAKGYNNLGIALVHKGEMKEAILFFKEAIRIWPGFAEAHNNLGNALFQKGEMKEAVHHFRETVRLEPDLVVAQKNLETVLLLLQELE